MKVKELLLKHAALDPKKCAFVFEGQNISFYQLKEDVFRLANYLIAQGLKKGDKVALYLPNNAQAVFGLLAALSIGLVLVPLDFMLTEEEVIDFINHSQSKALLIEARKGIDIEKIKSSCPRLKEIITFEEKGSSYSLDSILEQTTNQTPEVEIGEDDLAAIFYTSGSTGHPKGVMLTYRHLNNPPETINHFLGVTKEDVFLCGGVPFSHIGGLDYLLLMLYFGSTLILTERFHPLEFLKNIEINKVTIFCIVPAMFVAILSLKEYNKFNLSSLRYAVVFGASSNPKLLERFHEVYRNARLLNGWGMTETSAPNTFSPPDLNKLNSIGNFSFKMQAKIIDERGEILEFNQPGELLVKGEGVMQGYYCEEGLTKEVKTSDGWLKTGDIATYDREGLYYIVGRKKEMIKVAGEIVFAPEVEEKIQHHPKIKEVAVIATSDELRGEVPKAFIVLKEGENLDIGELKGFLKEHLAHFKMPHYFEVINHLPRNRTGKIDKTRLK